MELSVYEDEEICCLFVACADQLDTFQGRPGFIRVDLKDKLDEPDMTNVARAARFSASTTLARAERGTPTAPQAPRLPAPTAANAKRRPLAVWRRRRAHATGGRRWLVRTGKAGRCFLFLWDVSSSRFGRVKQAIAYFGAETLPLREVLGKLLGKQLQRIQNRGPPQASQLRDECPCPLREDDQYCRRKPSSLLV